MKILIVNYEYPPLGGGGGVATKDLAEELAKRHTVYVITSLCPGMKFQEQYNGVQVIRVPVFARKSLPTASILSMITFVPTAFIWGVWLCVRHRFSVINAQFVVPSGVPAYMLSFLFRIPMVLSFIGADLYDPSRSISPHRHWYLRVLIRMITRRAKACTAISEDTKKRAQELHNVQKEIHVAHLGVKPMKEMKPSRRSLGLPPTDFVAVSIGRLIPRKGFDTLIKAWKDVPEGVLVIVGDGPLKGELMELTEALDMNDRVMFTGRVSEERKYELLYAADLYVSSAEHEGFGIVFLEAMQASLPIIATAEGGHRDFLKEEANALFCKPHQPEALAELIRTLQEDDMLRDVIGERNRKDVENFYIEHTARRFEEILERVARDRK